MITRTCQAPKRDGSPGNCSGTFEQADHAHKGSGMERKYCDQTCTQHAYWLRRFRAEAVRRTSSADLKAELRARGIYDNDEPAEVRRWREDELAYAQSYGE